MSLIDLSISLSSNNTSSSHLRDGASNSGDQWQSLVSQIRSEYPVRFSQSFIRIPESLNLQRRRTIFKADVTAPKREMKQTPFLDFYNAVDPDSDYEKNVWKLASILFDSQDFTAVQIPEAEQARYGSRFRKDRLIDFWKSLTAKDASKAAESSSLEERTMALLSANMKVEACESLARAKNYRLASLVAQIGGNPVMHEQISSQVKAWNNLNTLSEMSEPIRAIYSLLSGATSVCEGKKAQHIEDKAQTFAISELFNLDWKRAFGLRLYYAIETDDPIETAVAAFAADLDREEPAKPSGDPMWTLLRLYTSSKLSQATPPLHDILLPGVSQSSAIPARLSFQLYFVLQNHLPAINDKEQADKATKLFAAQLDVAGEWLWALFALLHIQNLHDRETQVQALLASHAKDIHADPPHDSNSTWRTLTEELQVPASWIWEAKALYAKTVERNRVREANYLVKAGHWAEAHEVLKRIVGPECVIAEEWAQLQGLLEAFRPGMAQIIGWGLGGQLYTDYLALMLEYVDGKEKVKVLERLLDSLRSLTRDFEQSTKAQADEMTEKARFLQKVALKEMSDVVGREADIMKEKKVDSARKLQVPQRNDAYLKETISMSDRYFRALK